MVGRRPLPICAQRGDETSLRWPLMATDREWPVHWYGPWSSFSWRSRLIACWLVESWQWVRTTRRSAPTLDSVDRIYRVDNLLSAQSCCQVDPCGCQLICGVWRWLRLPKHPYGTQAVSQSVFVWAIEGRMHTQHRKQFALLRRRELQCGLVLRKRAFSLHAKALATA